MALVFTPGGDQLALLSDEDNTLNFWDVRKGRQLLTLPLRGGAGTFPQPVAEPGGGETAGTRPESSAAGGTAGSVSAGSPGPRPGPPGGGGRQRGWMPAPAAGSDRSFYRNHAS